MDENNSGRGGFGKRWRHENRVILLTEFSSITSTIVSSLNPSTELGVEGNIEYFFMVKPLFSNFFWRCVTGHDQVRFEFIRLVAGKKRLSRGLSFLFPKYKSLFFFYLSFAVTWERTVALKSLLSRPNAKVLKAKMATFAVSLSFSP